jgi:hypothetical protein
LLGALLPTCITTGKRQQEVKGPRPIKKTKKRMSLMMKPRQDQERRCTRGAVARGIVSPLVLGKRWLGNDGRAGERVERVRLDLENRKGKRRRRSDGKDV